MLTKTTKACTKCKEEKPLADYSDQRRSKDSKEGHCKTCRAAYGAALRRKKILTDPAFAARERARNLKNRRQQKSSSWPGWAASIISATLDRARRRGVPHAITKEDVLELVRDQNACCAISGLPLILSAGCGRTKNPFAPSIDQIIPGAGYTKDNIQIVCIMANTAKNNWHQSELINFCHAVSKKHKPVARNVKHA